MVCPRETSLVESDRLVRRRIQDRRNNTDNFFGDTEKTILHSFFFGGGEERGETEETMQLSFLDAPRLLLPYQSLRFRRSKNSEVYARPTENVIFVEYYCSCGKQE